MSKNLEKTANIPDINALLKTLGHFFLVENISYINLDELLEMRVCLVINVWFKNEIGLGSISYFLAFEEVKYGRYFEV